MVKKKAIEEFQEICLERHEIRLPFDEAAEQANQLIRFCKFAIGCQVTNKTEGRGKDEAKSIKE
ncbi:hypothetical protein [Desulfonatronospira sp.]|uniref:hypothetical protein n=1 Tax=Desulfonatronospira sp. TaxID=1962951 RepID=UPI0025C0345E|nr:hypothetical protein [Desulfonatronospira sp.]